MIKHLLSYLLFCGTMFAAGAPAVGGGGGSEGTGAAPGTGSAAPTAGSPPAADAGTGQAPQGGDNIRQLREAYEGVKRDFEPWQKLGVKPEQVGQFQGVYQKVYGEVASIGRELGYPDEEIAEAMAEDPVRTLDFLRNEAQRVSQGQQGQAGGEQDLNDLVAQHVEQVVGPIQERENLRMTNEANSLFERTVHAEVAGIFKGEGIDVANIPPDEMFMISSAASEILKYDEAALRALKYEGKTAPVQKAVREAITFLDKYYLARAARTSAKVQPTRPGQPAAQPGQKKYSLDEMIENPALVNPKYA